MLFHPEKGLNLELFSEQILQSCGMVAFGLFSLCLGEFSMRGNFWMQNVPLHLGVEGTFAVMSWLHFITPWFLVLLGKTQISFGSWIWRLLWAWSPKELQPGKQFWIMIQIWAVLVPLLLCTISFLLLSSGSRLRCGRRGDSCGSVNNLCLCSGGRRASGWFTKSSNQEPDSQGESVGWRAVSNSSWQSRRT